MFIALWIAAGILAGVMLIAGATKATQSVEKLQASGKGMDWTADVNPGLIRIVGIAEVLGAIGLIVPPLVGIAPILTPIAAAALAATMVGALIVHLRRGETQAIVLPLVLLALAIFVAWGRFGPHAF